MLSLTLVTMKILSNTGKGSASVLRRVLIMRFFGEFQPVYALYSVMIGQRGGLSPAQVGTVIATSFVLAVGLEIPTGVVADKIPRKYIILSALMSKILALCTMLMFPSFWGYIGAASFFALASALDSGAIQAYLYNLVGDNKKQDFGHFWANFSATSMAAYTLAYILAFLLGVRYDQYIITGIVMGLLSLCIGLGLPRDKLDTSLKTVSEVEILKVSILSTAIKSMRGSASAAYVFLLAIVVFAVAEVFIDYTPLHYSLVGIDLRYVPLVYAFGNVVGAGLFLSLKHWQEFFDKYKAHILAMLTVVLMLSFRGGVFWAASGYMVFTRFVRLLQIDYEIKLQHVFQDKVRATLGSLVSFVARLLSGLLAWIIGITAIQGSILLPLRYLLVLGSASILLLLFLSRKKRTFL
jgi:MFS family permease